MYVCTWNTIVQCTHSELWLSLISFPDLNWRYFYAPCGCPPTSGFFGYPVGVQMRSMDLINYRMRSTTTNG